MIRRIGLTGRIRRIFREFLLLLRFEQARSPKAYAGTPEPRHTGMAPAGKAFPNSIIWGAAVASYQIEEASFGRARSQPLASRKSRTSSDRLVKAVALPPDSAAQPT